MSWPQFKRWWETTDRTQLSPRKRKKLHNAAKFFKFYSGGADAVEGERLEAMVSELRVKHAALLMANADALPAKDATVSFHDFIELLIKTSIL